MRRFSDKGLIESTTNSSDKHIYHYDAERNFKKGEVIGTSNPAMKFTIKRNKENRIYSFKERSTDGYDSDTQYDIKYKYNKDGLVISADYGYWEAEQNYKYDYNDKGLIAKETVESSGYTLTIKSVYEYEYTEFDNYDNWITRIVTGVETRDETDDIGMGMDEPTTTTTTKKKMDPTIQTRTIVYY